MIEIWARTLIYSIFVFSSLGSLVSALSVGRDASASCCRDCRISRLEVSSSRSCAWMLSLRCSMASSAEFSESRWLLTFAISWWAQDGCVPLIKNCPMNLHMFYATIVTSQICGTQLLGVLVLCGIHAGLILVLLVFGIGSRRHRLRSQSEFTQSVLFCVFTISSVNSYQHQNRKHETEVMWANCDLNSCSKM